MQKNEMLTSDLQLSYTNRNNRNYRFNGVELEPFMDYDYLASFLNINYIKPVDLHYDIVNEPYTYLDTGLRPEIKNKRPFFSFKIYGNGVAVCYVNNKTIKSQISDCTIPAKFCTNISVVNIYDTYGLNMTYAYLYNISNNNKYDWMRVYLAGSLMVIRPDLMGLVNKSVFGLCVLLMTEFIAIEDKQPKLKNPLNKVTCILPPEILAKILKSQRINKEIGKNIIYDNRDVYREVSKEELMYYSRQSYTIFANGKFILFHHEIKRCDVWYTSGDISNYPFELIYDNSGIEYEYNYFMAIDTVAAFSIFDYLTVFHKIKGYSGIRHVIEMLKNLRCIDEKQARGWLVQLAHDTNYNFEHSNILNSQHIYEILHVLIDSAIAILESMSTIPKEKYEIELSVMASEPSTMSIHQDTHYVLTYWNQGIINEWSLRIKNGDAKNGDIKTFILSKYVGDEVEDDEMDGYIARYSIHDYITMFSLKGMDRNIQKNILLELIDMKVDDCNYKIVCSWIVQLSYDTSQGHTIIMFGFQELKEELNRLVNIMVSKFDK
jgi:hypothetical protein